MGDRKLQGFQKEVDEIGSLLVGTVQQVNERNEQVPDMLNRLDSLNAECARFQTTQDAKVSRIQNAEEAKVSLFQTTQEAKVSKRRSSSTGTSTRCKIILGICVAVGLILLILIIVLSVHAKGEEDEGVKASTELSTNPTQTGP